MYHNDDITIISIPLNFYFSWLSNIITAMCPKPVVAHNGVFNFKSFWNNRYY